MVGTVRSGHICIINNLRKWNSLQFRKTYQVFPSPDLLVCIYDNTRKNIEDPEFIFGAPENHLRSFLPPEVDLNAKPPEKTPEEELRLTLLTR